MGPVLAFCPDVASPIVSIVIEYNQETAGARSLEPVIMMCFNSYFMIFMIMVRMFWSQSSFYVPYLGTYMYLHGTFLTVSFKRKGIFGVNNAYPR